MSKQNRAAVAAAKMKEIRKDQYMAAKKYKFVSADAMYAAIRAQLFEAGITIHQDEIEFVPFDRPGRGGTDMWARVTYQFGLVIDETEPVANMERMTVVVRIYDTQSCAAARTIALKAWLRGKFLLPTGDDPQAEEPADSMAPGQRRKHRAAQHLRKLPEPLNEKGKWHWDGMRLRETGMWPTPTVRAETYLARIQRVHREKDAPTFLKCLEANKKSTASMPEHVQVAIREMGAMKESLDTLFA